MRICRHCFQARCARTPLFTCRPVPAVPGSTEVGPGRSPLLGVKSWFRRLACLTCRSDAPHACCNGPLIPKGNIRCRWVPA